MAIASAAGLSLFNYVLRIWRWRWYLSHQGHVLPVRFVSLTFMAGFAFTLSPGKLGEMARARYYQSHGVPLAAVSGAFFVERILDLLAMILLAFAALLDAQRYRGLIWVAAGLVIALLMVIALCPWNRVGAWLEGRSKPGTGLKVLVGTMVSARRLLSPGMLLAGLASGGFEIEHMRQLAQQRFGAAAVEAVDAWRAALAGWRDMPEEEQLRRVNEFFNRRIRFADDPVVWGQPDYWATPLETLGRGAGDCEDFVFAKYFSLRELGVPENRLRMTYVRAQIGGPGSSVSQAHMVLSYYASPEAVPLVLDNLIATIRPASARPDLAPVFSFNTQGVFVGGANQASTPVDRLSRWRELLLRMRTEGYVP